MRRRPKRCSPTTRRCAAWASARRGRSTWTKGWSYSRRTFRVFKTSLSWRCCKPSWACKSPLENDANAAGYAEHRYGAARDLTSSVYITLSTGVGGGVFVGDRVIHGATGAAGEVGHMTLLPGGPLCGCGHHGCWEALASGRAVARDASFSYGAALTTQEVFERARAQEPKALAVVDQAATYTGLGIANLLKVLDPDGFVLGGGMSEVGAFYLDRVRAAAERFAVGFAPVDIRAAELGTDAGVIGAAAMAQV